MNYLQQIQDACLSAILLFKFHTNLDSTFVAIIKQYTTMALQEELESQGGWLFRYRSFLPLAVLGVGILVQFFTIRTSGFMFFAVLPYWYGYECLFLMISLIGAFFPSFGRFKSSCLPFSWKKVVKKEKNGVFALFLLFSLFDYIVAWQTVNVALNKKTYDLSENIAQSGGSLLDAMKNLPGVTTNHEGKLLLRGSDKVTILIDRRHGFLLN